MIVGIGAIIRKNDEVLLLRRKRAPEAEYWSIPGGRVEEDETPEEAVVRELQEELGTQAEIVRYLDTFIYRSPNDSYEGISVLFEAKLNGDATNSEPDVHESLGWFPIDDLPHALAGPASHAVSILATRTSNEIRVDRYGKADVLLLQPFFPLPDMEALSIPLGLASIHSVLKGAGYKVCTLDCSLPSDYSVFCRQLALIEPMAVGVQFHSEMSFQWALRSCRRVRRELPNALIVAGGELATSKAEFLLREGYVDIVVNGEGERTFQEVVDSRFEGKNIRSVKGISFIDSHRLFTTESRDPIADLDELPLPEIRDLTWDEYGQWTLFTSRGCPFKCIYCSSAAYWKHSIRYHGAKRVLTEIQRLVSEFGATEIYIADDTFTLNKRRVHKICEGITRLRLKITWSCLTRVDCVDEPLLKAMYEAGCALISFGVETANQETLDRVLKGNLLERAEWALTACRRIGIQTRVSVIIGLPGETTTELLRTLDFLLRVEPNEVQLYGLTPHDGTALYENLDALGVKILQPDTVLWSRDVLQPVCETSQLKRDQIIEIAQTFVRRFREAGYIYLNEEMPKKKIGANKTIATSFSPVQVIGPVSSATGQ